MKPIPNPRDLGELRGLKYQIAATTPDGHPLQITFQRVRGGPFSERIRKDPRFAKATNEEQAAAPWYLRYRRPDGRRAWLRVGDAGNLAGALEKAVVTLGQAGQGDNARFDHYLNQIKHRSSLTIGKLATEWREAGYPRPDGRPRNTAEQRGIVSYLDLALRWWDSRGVTTITRRLWDEYVAARRAEIARRPGPVHGNRPANTGDRSLDLQRNALRCLCSWALATERIAANPFSAFPRARAFSDVVSCNQQMPATDDEFHLISRHLIGDGSPTPELVTGAQLLFQGLTGLRPGEPGALRWDAQASHQRHEAGLFYEVTLDGSAKRRLAVAREKGGMTPYVQLHPALEAFIGAWREYHRSHFAGSPWWFPAPWDIEAPLAPFGASGTSRLPRYLAQAIADLRLPYRRAHAWRAYYVRVRRSQDISDGQIADELGERTGQAIIRSTYGEPDGVRGDGLFDWLPSSGAPAWSALVTADATVVTPNFASA